MQLQTLRAIGPIGAWVLTTEIFGWREIRNGRQLGALVGLVPAPNHSGETEHDQGFTRVGNVHVRRVMVHSRGAGSTTSPRARCPRLGLAIWS